MILSILETNTSLLRIGQIITLSNNGSSQIRILNPDEGQIILTLQDYKIEFDAGSIDGEDLDINVDAQTGISLSGYLKAQGGFQHIQLRVK